VPVPPSLPQAPTPAGGATGAFRRPAGPEFTIVQVFYGTDRQTGILKTPGEIYQNERDPDGAVKYGVCEVSIPGPPYHRVGRLESPSIWKLEFREDPAKHVVLLGVRQMAAVEFFDSVKTTVAHTSGKEMLVFVHGYNITFEDAARRTAQLTYDLQFGGVAAMFSWPSRAETAAYAVDETNVAWASDHLRAFLAELSRTSGATTIHLIAHSMGNRAMVTALHHMALQRSGSEQPAQPPLFRHVVLTAPDIDAATFRQLASVFRQVAYRVTLYSCASDRALALSRSFHGYPRAGDCIVIVPGIDVIDASAVDTSLLGHSYVASNRSVISDIHTLITNGLPPSSRFGMSLVNGPDGDYYAFRP
jgi:esterase/lipase superfamily enzyme